MNKGREKASIIVLIHFNLGLMKFALSTSRTDAPSLLLSYFMISLTPVSGAFLKIGECSPSWIAYQDET